MISDHRPAECRYLYISWWNMFFNNRFYIASQKAAINFLFWTSILFFFLRLFPYHIDFSLFWSLNLLAVSCAFLDAIANLFALNANAISSSKGRQFMFKSVIFSMGRRFIFKRYCIHSHYGTPEFAITKTMQKV